MRKRETRQQKAERLVRDGCVEVECRWPRVQTAYVQGDHGCYHTMVSDSGRFWCMCEYGRYHNGTDDRCSHALALALAVGERGE